LVDASNRAIDNIETAAPDEELQKAIQEAGAATVSELQGVNGRLDTIIGQLGGSGAGSSGSGAIAQSLAASDAYIASLSQSRYAGGGF
jgi:mevalonate kinase